MCSGSVAGFSCALLASHACGLRRLRRSFACALKSARRRARPHRQAALDNQRHGLVDRDVNRAGAVFKRLRRIQNLVLLSQQSCPCRRRRWSADVARGTPRVDLPGVLQTRARKPSPASPSAPAPAGWDCLARTSVLCDRKRNIPHITSSMKMPATSRPARKRRIPRALRSERS